MRSAPLIYKLYITSIASSIKQSKQKSMGFRTDSRADASKELPFTIRQSFTPALTARHPEPTGGGREDPGPICAKLKINLKEFVKK
jgi:hypothetical protein